MKVKLSKRFFSLALALALFTTLIPLSSTTADAHWADAAMEHAAMDGIITDTSNPDANTSLAQLLTMLCRIFNPTEMVPYGEIGLTGNEWYAESAAKIAAMNIDFDESHLKNDSITRAEAFTVLADAFQIIPAEADGTELDCFLDCALITGHTRRALGAMTAQGYITGSNGNLNPNDTVSRAELMTVIYRIFSALTKGTVGSAATVASGEVNLSGGTYTNLWFGAQSKVSLDNITADTVVYMSQIEDLALSGSTHIKRLVLSGGEINKVKFNAAGDIKIDTLVLGSNSPENVTVTGNIGTIEVMGNNINLTINASVDTLIVAGDNSTVRVGVDYSVKNVRYTDTSANNTAVFMMRLNELSIDGSSNKITVSEKIESLTFGGTGCEVSGSGSAASLTKTSGSGTVDIECGTTTTVEPPKSLENASITFSMPDPLPAGETLNLNVTIKNEVSGQAYVVLKMDGKEIISKFINVTSTGETLSYSNTFTYTEDMTLKHTFELTMTYVDNNSKIQTIKKSQTLNMENYPYKYYHAVSGEEAVATVTCYYIGDYTLAWAESHDYSDEIKEAWVNYKGYTSTTQYLLWVNRTYQRVNIFQGTGKAGEWELIRTCIVGTGSVANGTQTPVGVYTVTYRQREGWTTSTYNCSPVVRFYAGSGYAFHSRLYNPAHTYLTSAAIGYPVSHGCVRMYDEDIWFIYNNVPDGTTVVVY